VQSWPPRAPQPDRRSLLERIARRCAADLAVEHVTISVATGPRSWSPAFSTSPLAERLDQHAYTVGEGPTFDVLRDHEPVLVNDVSTGWVGARWPVWSKVVDDEGIRSLAALPVHAGAITAGALSVYLESSGGLDRWRYELALRLTDLTFMGLLDLMAGLTTDGDGFDADEFGRSDADGERRDVAELLRADVHRAAGMIMVQADVPIDVALARLRASAFSSGRSLSEVAADVVARRLRFEPEERTAE
jgi:GAF domain-containing protein